MLGIAMNLVTMNRANAHTPFFAAILLMSIIILEPAARARTSSPGQPTAPAIFAKFEKSISTKKAKVGDGVSAKTVKDLRLKDLDIPKGSRLVGTVSAVQSQKEGNGDSLLSIKFDKVELKTGQILRIEGQIVSLAENSNNPGLGSFSVLSRGGVGSTPGVDPNLEIGGQAHDDIPPGSSLPGIALGNRLSLDGATELRGIHTDIRFDSETEVKVELFRSR